MGILGKTALRSTKAKKHFHWFKLLLICLALFVLAQLAQQYQRYQHIQAEVAKHQAALALAERNYNDLREQVRLLYRDSYLEQLARSSLGMIKDGEVVVSPAEISDVAEIQGAINEKDVFH